MATSQHTGDRVFPAMLKFWRGRRGYSQLDLGLAADVSARHVSFLETGRSRPSIEMVALLAETLDVPFRDRNEMLRAAGYPPSYPVLTATDALAGPLGLAVDAILRHGEPYPVMVIDRLYRVGRANEAARRFFAGVGIDVTDPETKLLELIFLPAGRELITNWKEFTGALLRRLHREVLHRPNDDELTALLDDLLKIGEIPEAWRQPSLDATDYPMVPLTVGIGGTTLSFLTTITAFNAPNNVTLDELRIESYFPLDGATDEFCHRLGSEGTPSETVS